MLTLKAQLTLDTPTPITFLYNYGLTLSPSPLLTHTWIFCQTQCLPHPHRAMGELTGYQPGILTVNPAASPWLSAPSMQFNRAVYKLFTLHSCTEPCHAVNAVCSRSQAGSCSDWQAGCEPWASQTVWVTVHIVNHRTTRW